MNRQVKSTKGKGCGAATAAAYKGARLYEVMSVDRRNGRTCFWWALPDVELKKKAIRAGMITLRSQRLRKSWDAVTTRGDVAREGRCLAMRIGTRD